MPRQTLSIHDSVAFILSNHSLGILLPEVAVRADQETEILCGSSAIDQRTLLRIVGGKAGIDGLPRIGLEDGQGRCRLHAIHGETHSHSSCLLPFSRFRALCSVAVGRLRHLVIQRWICVLVDIGAAAGARKAPLCHRSQ